MPHYNTFMRAYKSVRLRARTLRASVDPLAQALAIGTEVARAILELRPHEGTIAPWAWGAVLAVSLK